MIPQRTNKAEYVFIFWWANQELKQETVKVELLNLTKPEIFIFMRFVDTDSQLPTKPSNFHFKCHSNSESYDQDVFIYNFKGGQNCSFTVEGFFPLLLCHFFLAYSIPPSPWMTISVDENTNFTKIINIKIFV